MKIDHDQLDVLWNQISDEKYYEFTKWHSNFYHKQYEWDNLKGNAKSVNTRSIRFFKQVFGRQDLCATFLRRNWIWHRPDEGWTLYCDNRGMKLHVKKGLSSDEAFKAFCKFREHIDVFFEKLEIVDCVYFKMQGD